MIPVVAAGPLLTPIVLTLYSVSTPSVSLSNATRRYERRLCLENQAIYVQNFPHEIAKTEAGREDQILLSLYDRRNAGLH